ncbi:hypothetical protein KR059_003311 [Drosophila kikkawai]|nr:hypothetical protein KR059_003311 [Drosophila kikkawai]
MGAPNNANSSIECEANEEDTCCFLIIVGKDDQVGSKMLDSNPDSGRTLPARRRIPKWPPRVKPKKWKKHSVSMATMDSRETNDLHVGSDESEAALSMDKISMSITPLDEIQNAGSTPLFIQIGDRILANRPSFTVVKDASTQNEIMEYLDHSESRSECCQLETVSQVMSSHAECQTDEMGSQVDMASINNSCFEGVQATPNLSQPVYVPTAVPVPHIQHPSSSAEETRVEAGGAQNFSLQVQSQPQTQEIEQQQEQQPQLPNNSQAPSPLFTISLVALPQASSRSGISVAPCQQLQSAVSSNASCSSFCTSNCCLSRPPQGCQMSKTTCCSPQNLGRCLLTPYGYPYRCCSRSAFCCPVSSPQHQSSQGFPGHCNKGGMPASNQVSHHAFRPVLSKTGFAPGGNFRPGINPCQAQPMPSRSQWSHCRMKVHQYPHCNCARFVNNQQQQFPVQMGQLIQQGHLSKCSCSFSQQSGKEMRLEECEEEGLNQNGLNNFFSKEPQISPSARTQPLSKDQKHQEQTAEKDTSSEAPRGGGATNISSTTLFSTRCGRTCLILKPTETSNFPRLLTRRISRFTSMVIAPK